MPDIKKQAIIVTGVLGLANKAYSTAVSMNLINVTPLTPDILTRPDNGIVSFMVAPHGISDSNSALQEDMERADFVRWLKEEASTEWCVIEFGIDTTKTRIMQAWDSDVEESSPSVYKTNIPIMNWITDKKPSVYSPDVVKTIGLWGGVNYKSNLGNSEVLTDFVFLADNPESRSFIKRQTKFRKWTITSIDYIGSKVSAVHVVRGFNADGLGWVLGSTEVEATPSPEAYTLIVD